MPHMPKSKLTEKDMKATMRIVREAAVSAASIAMKREKEEKRLKAMAYKDLKVKELLLDEIITEINRIKDSNTQDMYHIVEELCNESVKNYIISNVSKRIEEFDNNPVNLTKINSTHIDLTKTIEREFNLYMIELIVRAEVEEMKNDGVQIPEIINVLNLEKKGNYEERGKALRRRVRAVVRILYGLPEKEQRIDKLREESRTVMRNVAKDLELRQQEEQNKNGNNINPVGGDSDPDSSDR